MRLVKLGAISSTNDFLKEMAASSSVDEFTVVTAESQTAGRGQMGAKWESEPGKNLIMSVYTSKMATSPDDIFSANVKVANSIVSVLLAAGVPKLSVKWPNDIMSGAKKIGGILIENTFKANARIESIIGIGLNVNQNDFRELPRASSISIICGRNFDLDQLTMSIAHEIERRSQSPGGSEWQQFHESLFRIGVPTAFEALGEKFMGKILGVSRDGKLRLELADQTTAEFGIREVAMLY